MLAAENDIPRAEAAFKRVLDTDDVNVEAALALADLLARDHRTSEATQLLERLVERKPDAAVAAYRLARLYVDSDENLDAALSLALKAKQQRPNDPAVSDALGWVYTRKNRPALALVHLRDAVQASPDDASYRYHLGSAYLSAGDARKARLELTRALQIDQNFAGAAQARVALASIQE